MKFPFASGYWPLVYDYDVCNRPDVCNGCLQLRHLKAECKRLTLERLGKQQQPCLELT